MDAFLTSPRHLSSGGQWSVCKPLFARSYIANEKRREEELGEVAWYGARLEPH